MKIKIIALMLVLILLNSNIAFAQLFNPITTNENQDLFGRELAGDAIFVEVAGYEPMVVPASVLNDQEVPVYVYLKGTTLGGLSLGSGSLETAPFYGLPKIKDLKTTWQNFEMMGFKPGVLWGTIVAVVEFFGGLLLISGLLTSAAAFVLAIEMAVATIWKIKRGQKLAGGFELDLLLVVSLLTIATLGGGIYSLDSYWRIVLF